MNYRDYFEYALRTSSGDRPLNAEELWHLMGVVHDELKHYIFSDEDNNSGSNSEWEKASMPKSLLGDWYVNGIHNIGIKSSVSIIDSREWGILSIDTNGEEYRIIVRSNYQYRAIYFREISDKSAEKSMGYIANTSYEAKNVIRGPWITITK